MTASDDFFTRSMAAAPAGQTLADWMTTTREGRLLAAVVRLSAEQGDVINRCAEMMAAGSSGEQRAKKRRLHE